MKNRFLFLFLFLSITISSQIIIKGTVYKLNGPLEGAAVYLNNSMLGTTSNENGEFEIQVEEGQYNLIVSYLGYKKINYSINTLTYKKPLVFVLEEIENVLDEIVIKKTVYDDTWKYNLSVFKREFIGKTEIAKDCEILNPEVLHFDYEKKEQILTAFARKPLKIKHKTLGYLITFELENFFVNKKYSSYFGYTRYKELKGSKRKQKRWKKNRQKAYNGSHLHFYRSLINNTFKKEGFIVNQFKRIKNPERPSEEEIKKARELIRLYRGNNKSLTINSSDKNLKKMTAFDSALVVVRKARMPKTKDYLYKSKLKRKHILKLKDNQFYFSFKDNLSVVYTKELEEKAYITRNMFSKPRKALPQTSAIIPVNLKVILGKRGVLINPLDVFYDGYWSFEKFGNTLPLDYVPED